MTDSAFDTLRAAVNLARNEQINTVAMLRRRLLRLGHAANDIDEALNYWGNHYRRHGIPLP